MSRLSVLRNRDPFWEVDGPAARGARRRQQVMSILAFIAATGAVAGAAFTWLIRLGVAPGLGIHA